MKKYFPWELDTTIPEVPSDPYNSMIHTPHIKAYKGKEGRATVGWYNIILADLEAT